MKKKIMFALCAMIFTAAGVFAQEQDIKHFRLDANAGISFGLLNTNTGNSNLDTLGNLAGFMLTLRGGVGATFRYAFNDYLSAGVNAGVYYMTYSGSSGNSVTLLDFPLHAVARVSWNALALEPFVGYYVSPLKNDYMNFGGLEVGGKAMVGPVYGSCSMVFGNPQYTRIELGVQINNIAKF